MKLVLALALASFSLSAMIGGCGSATKPAEGPDTLPVADAAPAAVAADPPADPEREAALAKLKAAQEAGCGGMCEVLTGCAVEDARKNENAKDAEELAKLAPKAIEECATNCKAASLSVRQVVVMHECLRAETTECAAHVECFSRVSRGGN